MDQVVRVRNAQGLNLHGVLHLPEKAHRSGKKIAVHLLNPGLKSRIAPNRMNVKIARRLVENGFSVLRLDPAGIGDSQGSLPEIPVTDLWGEIQVGRFVEDAQAGNEFLERTVQPDLLVLAGSCGGAITALLVGAGDKRINHFILIDVPVCLSSTKMMAQDYMSIIDADERYRSVLSLYYMKSVFSPRSLKRFLTFKSDYRAIAKVVSLKWKALFGQREDRGAGEEPDIPNMNPHFLQAVNGVMARRAKLLFLCAEKDTDTQLFEKGYRRKFLKPGNPYEDLYEIIEIKDANHIYTSHQSQQSLLSAIEAWMLDIE